MDVLINLMVVFLSQCILVTNHHVVHFKYLTILFASYTSMKLKFEKKKEYRLAFSLNTKVNLAISSCNPHKAGCDQNIFSNHFS